MRTKLIKIDNYWIVVSDEGSEIGEWTSFTNTTNGIIKAFNTPIQAKSPYASNGTYNFKVIASQNPDHKLPNITFSEEVAKELGEVDKDFWEAMPIEWIKWTKKQPDWNGSVYLQFNGKNQGLGIVNNKQLLKLAGEDTKYHIEDGKLIADYTKNQLEMLDSVYWLKQDFSYNQCKEDNKEKKYTEADMIDFARTILSAKANHDLRNISDILPKYIQSLNKQEYEVEIQCSKNGIKKEGESCTLNNKCIYPKCLITNNSITIIKLLN